MTGQWAENGMGLLVPESVTTRYRRPVAIDLFAGAGGFSVGLHQAGYHVVAASDNDPWAAITYMENLGSPGATFHFDTDESAEVLEKAVSKHLGLSGKGMKGIQDPDLPDGVVQSGGLVGSGWIGHYGCTGCDLCRGIGWDGEYNEYLAETNAPPAHGDGCEHFFFGDAFALTGAEILDAIGLGPGDVDLVVGGPPCQGFSMAGRRNVHDPRNSLVFEFMRIVLEIQPRAFAMENVLNILSMTTPEGLNVVDALCRVAEDGGFGPYDTLKQMLLASSDAGAALKSSAKTKGQRDREERRATRKDRELAEQGSLL